MAHVLMPQQNGTASNGFEHTSDKKKKKSKKEDEVTVQKPVEEDNVGKKKKKKEKKEAVQSSVQVQHSANEVTFEPEQKKKKKHKSPESNGSVSPQVATGTVQTTTASPVLSPQELERKRQRKEQRRLLRQQQAAQTVQPAVSAQTTTALLSPEEMEKEKKRQRKEKRRLLRQQEQSSLTPTQPSQNGQHSTQQASFNGVHNGQNEPSKRQKTVDVNTPSTSSYTEHPDVSSMTQTQVEEFRKQLALTVSEAEIRPVKTFAQAQFPDSILRCLTRFEKPSPIQAQCWPALLMGRDVIGIAKTGSGKTLGFMLPAYVKIFSLKTKQPLVLVLAPTRELALQSAKVCNDMEAETKVKAVCVYGGGSQQEQLQALKQGAQVVIATPGRLQSFLQEGAVKLSSVVYTVLDEADRMLDMGFEPAVRAIMDQVSKQRQTLLFSATWPASVQKLGNEFVTRPFRVTVGSDQLTANHDVAQIVEVIDEAPAAKDRRLLALMKQYHQKDLKNRVLVFVLYKKDVPRVERLLCQNGYGCTSISSDRSQEDRIRALEAFRNGAKPVLVGTDVASRGLDIPDVSHVINYSFPLTIEDYIHRIGRTGRSGKRGVSHTFFTKNDKGLSGELVNVLREANVDIPADLLKFGTGVKKKEHEMYGAHYKSLGDAPMPERKRVVF